MNKKRKIEHLFKKMQGLCLAVVITISLFPAKHVEAATSSVTDQFKQELIQMIFTVDQSAHDVYHYRLTGSEVSHIFNELKQSDNAKWMIAAYYSNLCVNYSTNGKYVSSVMLGNVDADVAERYKRLETNVAKIKSGIEPKMTNLDKIMYLHDCIVELASYRYVAYQSYGAGGILGDKVGVCAGYTKALNLLLGDQGINTVYMSSDAINHGWTAVYLDGQWYHIDSTWDDTRSSKSGLTSRKFLLRNDSEFVTSDKNSHVSWTPWNYNQTVLSTSNKYTNWYVHDIVGKMAFEGGYWYYVDNKTNSIMQNTAAGGEEKVILDGNGKSIITLVDATSAGITYIQDGDTKVVGYEGITEDPEEKAETKGVSAGVYIALPDGSWVGLGNGVIKEAKPSRVPEEVKESIICLPDMQKYEDESHYVDWTAITCTADYKRWFLKGTLKEHKASAEISHEDEKEVVTSEPTSKIEGVNAGIYIVLLDGSWVGIGNGVIKEAKPSRDPEEVKKSIVSLPDLQKYVDERHYIEWTAITCTADYKRWFLKGALRER